MRSAGGTDGARDPEVGDLRLLRHQHDVFGLDIPVHHAGAVRVVERGCHLARDRHGVFDGESRLAQQPLAERLARDVRHDVVQAAVPFAGIEKRHDVRMGESGGDADLLEKPLGPERGGQLRAEHLDRDGAGVARVLGQKQDRHAAAIELALDRVAIADCCLQPGPKVEHGPILRPVFDASQRGSNPFT